MTLSALIGSYACTPSQMYEVKDARIINTKPNADTTEVFVTYKNRFNEEINFMQVKDPSKFYTKILMNSEKNPNEYDNNTTNIVIPWQYIEQHSLK
ncbi:MAG: hypothetical protein ACOCUT_00610 [bacterium]